jgi:hypothetical protein
MPNWCMNNVTLRNENKDLVDALEEHLREVSDPAVETAEGFANFFRPNPDGEWDYGWSCENWGTKWDPHPEDWTREDDETITIIFDSAWSPPTELYEYLVSEEGGDWSVQAYYHEPGMGFVGMYDDGLDESYEYDFSNPDWKDEIPEELVDFAGLDYEYDDWKDWNEEDEEEVD